MNREQAVMEQGGGGVINDPTISEFQLNLSYESWDNVFDGDDVDTIFNNFLNTYFTIFYHTFPLKKCQYNYNIKPLITPGRKISSQRTECCINFVETLKIPC